MAVRLTDIIDGTSNTLLVGEGPPRSNPFSSVVANLLRTRGLSGEGAKDVVAGKKPKNPCDKLVTASLAGQKLTKRGGGSHVKAFKG